MKSGAGRSQYVPNQGVGVMDAGAFAVAVVFEEIALAFTN
jgi:hypothetical protein